MTPAVELYRTMDVVFVILFIALAVSVVYILCAHSADCECPSCRTPSGRP